MNKNSFALGILAGVTGLVFLICLAVIVIPYTGLYNVAASRGHAAVTRWAFETTLTHSVRSHAQDVAPPTEFTDAMIAAGASEYKSMCQHCHGGPGVEQERWAKAMLPQPPKLSEAVRDWQSSELYWLVKHGIKMSAMPAFGEYHSDDAIWTIVAFVETLPGMSKEKYESYGNQHSDPHSH